MGLRDSAAIRARAIAPCAGGAAERDVPRCRDDVVALETPRGARAVKGRGPSRAPSKLKPSKIRDRFAGRGFFARAPEPGGCGFRRRQRVKAKVVRGVLGHGPCFTGLLQGTRLGEELLVRRGRFCKWKRPRDTGNAFRGAQPTEGAEHMRRGRGNGGSQGPANNGPTRSKCAQGAA